MTLPFPGESVGLDSLAIDGVLAEFVDASRIYYRADSLTLAAGTEWRVWVAPWWATYVEPGLGSDVVVTWVVEVESGSVTASVSEELDGSPYNTATAPATGLGSVTLSAGTNRITSTIDAETFAAGSGYALLALDATAGSAVVSQVKLEFMPADGFLGGESPLTEAPQLGPYEPTFIRVQPLADGGTYENSSDTWQNASTIAQAEARANLAAATTTDVASLTPSASTPVAALAVGCLARPMQDDGSGGYAEAACQVADIYVRRAVFTANPPGVEGVDWIRYPTEVRNDDNAEANATGSPSYEWEQPDVTLIARPTLEVYDEDLDVLLRYPSNGDYYFGQAATADPGDLSALPWSGVLPGSTVLTPTPGPKPEDWEEVQRVTLAETDSRYIRLGLSHASKDERLPDQYPEKGPGRSSARWHAGVFDGDDPAGTYTPVRYYATPAPFRYWTLTPVTRGIVRHYPRDDGVRGSSPKRHGGHRGSYQAGRQLGYQ